MQPNPLETKVETRGVCRETGQIGMVMMDSAIRKWLQLKEQIQTPETCRSETSSAEGCSLLSVISYFSGSAHLIGAPECVGGACGECERTRSRYVAADMKIQV